MSKNILIVHGFEIFTNEHPLHRYLSSKGHKIVISNYLGCQKIFNINVTVNSITKQLKFKPDVIIGISLGGLIIPKLIRFYPNSKYIFIATCPIFNPTSKLLLALLKLPKISISIFISFLKLIKLKLYRLLFKDLSKAINYKLIQALNISYLISLIMYIKTANNIEILNCAKSSLYVIGGKGDEIMPVSNWNRIGNTKVIQLNAKHHNVINSESLRRIGEII
ncbi:hypothetical protein M0R04_00460 [Candidatus Dojkabacteria bacterium]|nr:hypothetical protein [Candidatus Dojkabacteria bacterium]